MKRELKFVIIDDHPIVQEGLGGILSQHYPDASIKMFQDATSFLTALDNLSVDLLFLDVSLPDVNGPALCRQIRSLNYDMRILGFSNHDELSIVRSLIAAGADGYLIKTSGRTEIINCVEDVLSGKKAYSNGIASQLMKTLLEDEKVQLTKREKEILKWVCNGSTNAEIAENLFISQLTVETHRRNLMQKMKAHNAAELVRRAMEQGLV